MEENFLSWLQAQLAERNWTQAELARRSGISTASISRIFSGARNTGTDVCQAIALALRLPPDELYRRAGLLPNIPDDDKDITELDHIARQLDNANKYELIRYARMKLQIQEEGGKYHADNHQAGEISEL